MSSVPHPSSSETEEAAGGFVGSVADWISDFGDVIVGYVAALGDFAMFVASTFNWTFTRLAEARNPDAEFLPDRRLEPAGHRAHGHVHRHGLGRTKLRAVPRALHIETRLGGVINMSLVRELGPVLAATMLAGRVGGSMAAELGTMRVTEQIDALASMGANPIHYLVVPRFLGCLMLDPHVHHHGRLHGRRRRLVLQRAAARYRLAPLLAALARDGRRVRCLQRHLQELVLRRGDRAD
jgi:phospholipid/cholesterol/gamma-HCH transport system permease protein